MLRTFVFTIVLALTAGTAALAQTLPPQPPPPQLPGTQKERTACQGDVMKFCRKLLPANPNALPDTFGIANCLLAHRAHISAACNAVLSGHGR